MSLKTFYASHHFPVVTTRAANVYGPGQQLYRIIPRTILFILLGKKLELHGGGESTRSFIHMRDVSDATFRIALSGRVGETYHISTRDYLSIKDLVEKIASLTDVQFSDLAEVTGDRLGKDQAYLLESKKLREELGWADNISLDVGLQDTLSWIDKNLEILKVQNTDYVHKP
jgi:dTDP-glucose 4,6-dehydratase